MSVSTVAHLNFTGNARQALTFYHSVFGGQVGVFPILLTPIRLPGR